MKNLKKPSPLPRRLESYFDRLWPICRSILGPGFRQSLDILSEMMPMERLTFPTGTQVLDWVVPQEWRPKNAYFIGPDGKKRADFQGNNLHLVQYSAPFKGRLSLSKLKPHLHSLPQQPEAVPYLTSYYQNRWGFCITDRELKTLPEGSYEVVVDAELLDGELIVGEAVLEGRTDREIMLSSYLCHPSLANNELSGPLVLCALYERLAGIADRKYTYRFVLLPETIGAVAFLSRRGRALKRKLVAGYQLTCLGDSGRFTYKKSRQGNSLADRAALCAMREMRNDNILPFNPAVGSDERQYCSPGFDLPVGSLMRTMYTLYPEYHTSLDDKSLMDFDGMAEAVELYARIIGYIEGNRTFRNTSPYGEPQLGRRGLFRSLSGKDRQEDDLAMWWLLNYSDGRHDLLAIAELSGHSMETLMRVGRILEEAKLLRDVPMRTWRQK